MSPNTTQSISFQKSYTAGDVVQFQVGSNFTTGNAVGLQLTIAAVPEPSTLCLTGLGLAAAGLYRFRRKRSL
jgi:hypothetical protein